MWPEVKKKQMMFFDHGRGPGGADAFEAFATDTREDIVLSTGTAASIHVIDTRNVEKLMFQFSHSSSIVALCWREKTQQETDHFIIP